MNAVDFTQQEVTLEAYEQIYDTYIDRLYRFIYFKVPSKEDAQDITADVFYNVYAYLKRKKKVRHVQAFLYKVARRSIADFYREQKKLGVSLEDHTQAQELADPVDAEQMSWDADKQFLYKHLKTLPEQYQEIILLRHIEGYSVPEVSVILKKSQGAVRILSHRALKALQTCCEQDLIKQLEQFSHIQTSSVFKEETKHAILSQRQKESYRDSWISFVVRPLSYVALSLLFVFAGSFGAVHASQESLPGTFLYPIKLASEQVKQQFVSKKEKTNMELALVTNRLSELRSLMTQEQVDASLVQATLKRYNDKVFALQAAMDDKESLNSVNAVQIAKEIAKQKGELQQVIKEQKGRLDSQLHVELTQQVKHVEQQSKEITKKALAVMVEDIEHVQSQKNEAVQSLAGLVQEELDDTKQRLEVIQKHVEEEALLAVREEQEISEEENTDPVAVASVSKKPVFTDRAPEELAASEELIADLTEQITEVSSLLETEGSITQAVDKLQETKDSLRALEETVEVAKVQPISEGEMQEDESGEKGMENTEILDESGVQEETQETDETQELSTLSE